ncbi:MAG: sigma-70 family RNA polymerase sigma factor [Clostridia bacterium]
MKVTIEERNKLIMDNMGLVINMVKRFKRKCRFLENDDLVNEGVIGMIKGIERFDEKKSKFSTYISIWIMQAITIAIVNKENGIRIPKDVKKGKKYDENHRHNVLTMSSLDKEFTSFGAENGNGSPLENSIPSNINIENEVVNRIWNSNFTKLVQKVLTPKQMDIFNSYFYEDIILQKVADDRGMCQSKASGLRKLRNCLKEKSYSEVC